MLLFSKEHENSLYLVKLTQNRTEEIIKWVNMYLSLGPIHAKTDVF